MQTATPSTRTIAYIRVSTDKQADHGCSLDAQRAKLTAYAVAMDLDLVAVIEDAGFSASTLDRPGLTRALAMLRRGEADALLVVKMDRLTRSVRDLGELLETHFGPGGRSLLSVGDSVDTRSAVGRLMLNLLASVSQWEREACGERTAVAMQHKASLGEFTGGAAPYGFRLADDGVRLAPVDEEQTVITTARDLRARRLSLRAVAAELAARGHRARNGRPFAAQQVARMVAA
jgi:site-specific DNA recombinase